MQSKSKALIKSAVRPLFEGLETRKLFAMTVAVVDHDNNGTLDVLIEGDNASDTVTIVDNDKLGSTIQLNDPTAVFSIDADNNGVFTDPGDSDAVVMDTTGSPITVGGGTAGPIETYKLSLQGGDDTVNFTVGGTWNDSEKSILADLTYSYGITGVTDKDTFNFDANGKEFRNKTDLTIDVVTGVDHDEANLDFAKLNRAFVNVNLDMGTPGTDLYPCEMAEMNAMAFEALDTNGVYGGGDEVRIDFNGDIQNWSTINVNVQYGTLYQAIVIGPPAVSVDSDYINTSSLTLIVFHKTIDNSDVNVDIQGGGAVQTFTDGFPNTNLSLYGDAVNIVGVLFRSDLKNDTEVFVNYNGGADSIDLVGVGLDKGFDQRANADLYIDLQGGDNFDVLAVATTNILPPVSLASGETNTVEWNTGTKFYYTLNLGDGGYRLIDRDVALSPILLQPEQAFVMLGYNFFNDGHEGPASIDDTDDLSLLVSSFLNDRDIRVHAGAKHRGRMMGGNGDDDLYMGYGITKDAPTSTGNFDLSVEGGFGFDYVAYAFDKAGGLNLTANNFKASGKALLDGGGEGASPLGNQIGLGDVLDLIIDDGKSRNRNFEVNGSYPNL